jgi:hypothetical protein
MALVRDTLSEAGFRERNLLPTYVSTILTLKCQFGKRNLHTAAPQPTEAARGERFRTAEVRLTPFLACARDSQTEMRGMRRPYPI